MEEDTEALYPIVTDKAALHICAYSVEEFIHRVFRRQARRKAHDGDDINPTSRLHFQKGVRILRQRLLEGDEASKVSDSTISIVVKLASAAHFDGDEKAARLHMRGLRKMIDLRGGLSNVFVGKRVMVEMLRTDLSIAILTSSPSTFFDRPEEPIPPYPSQLLPPSSETTESMNIPEWTKNLDEELSTLYKALRFCLLINLGSQTHRFISPGFIHEAMIAVLYRLLHLNFSSNSLNETIGLGLLAFTYHIFLQWKDITLSYLSFSSSHKRCLLNLQVVKNTEAGLKFWLGMIGCMTFWDIDEEIWLRRLVRDVVEECNVSSWKDVKEILRGFLWIGILDDEVGKGVYERVTREGFL